MRIVVKAYKEAECIQRFEYSCNLHDDENTDKLLDFFEVGGIKIAAVTVDEFVADEQKIAKDIEAAKNSGAEFIICFCNYEGQYGNRIEDNQARLVKMTANAGADYILGCNKECIQPYSILVTRDGQEVPVLYSAGKLIIELGLRMNEDGTVCICSEGYYPFIDELDEDQQKEETIKAMMQVGASSRFKCLADITKIFPDQIYVPVNETAVKDGYEVQPINIIRNSESNKRTHQRSEYIFDETEGIYRKQSKSEENELEIVCAGQIQYDAAIEKNAESFGEYEFLKSFKGVADCFNSADLVVGNLMTMSSDAYPSILKISKADQNKFGFNNCRKEYISALSKVGFDCLAAGNSYNAGMGIQGLFDTERIIAENDMISSGIGYKKDPIIEINGIKIAVLSTVAKCINHHNIFTDIAATQYTNIFDEDRMRKVINDIKAKGAEFILVYVNCGNGKDKLNLKARKSIAENIAEIGADYIICTESKTLSKYYKYTTSDEREVPIATSVSCFITGKNDGSYDTALLKLKVRRNRDGKIKCNDNYIPLKVCKEYNGIKNVIVPALEYYNGEQDFIETKKNVKDRLGDEIKIENVRNGSMKGEYTATLTIKEIYDVLGKKPSRADLKKLGELYEQNVSCITMRKTHLRKGCAVILYEYKANYQAERIQCTIDDCVEAGASLVISNKQYDELPCIVMDESLIQVFIKLCKTIKRKHDPITVAITGSMGKTTTKELMVNAFETHYKTLYVSGNYNTTFTIGQVIQKLDEDDEAYIQEVHGGSLSFASQSSKLIEPDICVITNIEKNHIEQVGSLENLIMCKMEITDGLKENGVLIINNDNINLRNVTPSVRTIRYSTFDDTCEYYTKNIRVEDEDTCFDIVCADSEFDTAGVYPARLKIHGEHNVSNAIAAFAAARQAGVPAYKIIEGLSWYRTKGARQNVIEHNGIKMIVDVNNSNPIALQAMFEVFQDLEPEKDGRKIAVLGMMGEQGEESKQIHYDTGKAISEYDYDLLLCFGEDAKYMAQGARAAGKTAVHFTDRAVFNKVISDNVKSGDVVLFKASHSMEFRKDTILPIFGDLGGLL